MAGEALAFAGYVVQVPALLYFHPVIVQPVTVAFNVIYDFWLGRHRQRSHRLASRMGRAGPPNEAPYAAPRLVDDAGVLRATLRLEGA